MHYLLVINPGSTSTKISVYENEKALFTDNIEHDTEELKEYKAIFDQYNLRKEHVLKTLEKHNFNLKKLTAVVARGGLLPPVKAGAFIVNEDMLKQLKFKPTLEHASNLGAAIADSIAKPLGLTAYVYDPVTVDEMIPLVRITGRPEIKRRGVGHNLNMRAAAIKEARNSGEDYKNVTYIVVHLGGGITMSLQHKGQIIDMISDDEGPFSPERAGGLPINQLIDLFLEHNCDKQKFMRLLRGTSGFMAYFNTVDTRKVIELAQKDENAKLIFEALALNIAKNVAKLTVVTPGEVSKIILTGGLAHSEWLISLLKERLEFLAKVIVIPGENEMESLALGILRVLNKEETPNVFTAIL